MFLLSLVTVGLAFSAISANAYEGKCGAQFLGQGNDVNWQDYDAGDEHLTIRTCTHKNGSQLYIDVKNTNAHPVCVTFIRHTDMRKDTEALIPNEVTYFFVKERYDVWQLRAHKRIGDYCR